MLMRGKKPINVQIGANIQHAREKACLTQDKLSELIGVTPNHISAIERGVYGISLENLQKLCQLLNVSADYIVFGDAPSNEDMAIAHRIATSNPKYKDKIMQGIEVLLSMSEVE